MATKLRKILTIDDEEAIVDLIVDILEANNYEAIRASKWTDAVDALNHEQPDVVLLDLKMPTIDGSSMLEFIRNEGFQVPVIIVSGFVTDTVARELSHKGVSGFVHKPFKSRQLLSEIEKALESAPVSTSTQPPEFKTPLDALYGTPLQAAPEADEPTESQALPSMDLLYGDSPQAEDSHINTEEAPQSPEREVLKAFENLEKKPETSSATPLKKPPPELLEALTKDGTSNGGPVESPSESPPKEAAPVEAPTNDQKSPVPVPTPVPPSQPGPAESTTAQVSPFEIAPSQQSRNSSPPDRLVSRPQHHHTRLYASPRNKIGRKNWIYMGVITFVCMIVAGFLAVMQYVASEFDPAEFQAKTQEAISKQATQEILKELQKQQGR